MRVGVGAFDDPYRVIKKRYALTGTICSYERDMPYGCEAQPIARLKPFIVGGFPTVNPRREQVHNGEPRPTPSLANARNPQTPGTK